MKNLTKKSFIIFIIFIIVLSLNITVNAEDDVIELNEAPAKVSDKIEKFKINEIKSKIVIDGYDEIQNGNSESSILIQNKNIPISKNKLNFAKQAKLKAAVETKYDGRQNIFTDPRDQMDTNSCWTFSTATAISYSLESLFPEKYNSKEKFMRLSTSHIDYMTSNSLNGSLFPTSMNRDVADGGNFTMGLQYATSGAGPVLESDYGFVDHKVIVDSEGLKNKKVQAKINDSIEFPTIIKADVNLNDEIPCEYEGSDINSYSSTISCFDYYGNDIDESDTLYVRNSIKEQIKKYGSAIAQMHFDVSFFDGYESGKAINKKAKNYYCNNLYLMPNHQVVIIGWDDNYSRTNFNKNNRYPVHDGAYIVQNSHGTSWQDGGFMYISYDDCWIESGVYGVQNVTDDLKYTNIYQYDYMTYNTYISADSEIWLAQKYNYEKKVADNEREYIDEVSVYLSEEAKVEVYVNTVSDSIDKGIKLVKTTENLKPGYHIIKLDQPQIITGQKFSVVERIISVNEDQFITPLVTKYLGNNFSDSSYSLWENVKVQENQTFVGQMYSVSSNSDYAFEKDGVHYNLYWDDLAGNNYNATNMIKVFTNKISNPIQSVSLSESNISLKMGESKKIIATINPTDTYDSKNITWKSDNENIAKVDTQGNITAIGVGTTKISATTVNGKVATCNVTVTHTTVAITGVTLDKTNITLNINTTAQLKATINPSNTTDSKTITWKSNNTGIATVSSSGLVTAKGPGSTTIIATTSNGKTASCTINVKSPITGVSLNKANETLNINTTLQLAATISPSNTTDGKTITWKSNNTGIATVSSSGLVTAKWPGSTTIIATTSNGKTASCTINVKSPITSVTLSKTSATINKGANITLTATINPNNTTDNKTITWTSSNNGVATVSNGKVVAVNPGSATITAKTTNGKTATCKITVPNVPITGISLNKTSATISKGSSLALTATINPSNTTDSKSITWTSSDTKVATVNGGNVYAVNPGQATITAKTTNGKTATCQISVNAPIKFNDVKNTDWFYYSVCYVYANKIITGYNDYKFGPSDKVTRGMLVAILYKCEGQPAVSGNNKFPDVQDKNQYYYNAVKWASDKGIVKGYADGRFGPNDKVTREQLAVFLQRYAQYLGRLGSSRNNLSGFGDYQRIDSYAVDAMKWANAYKVINGTADKKLNPLGHATRAEVAAMMENFSKRIK